MAMPERLNGAHRTTLREVRDPADPALTLAWQLLRRNFPPSELVPRRELVATLRESSGGVLSDLNWHLMVATRGARVVGAASGWYLGSLNVGVIGYVVVNHDTRSAGLGPRLRRRLQNAFELDARRIGGRALAALVGEVEEPNPWLRHLVSRRGAIPLDVPYLQPSLHRTDRPTRLVLYYEPLGAPRRWLPVSLVKQLLFAMWRRVYRIPRPLDSPTFQSMIRSLKGRSRIGALKLSPVATRRTVGRTDRQSGTVGRWDG